MGGLRADIKALKDSVKFVADRLHDTADPFRRHMNSFVKVISDDVILGVARQQTAQRP